MFQFPRLPPTNVGSLASQAGFPHSGTLGSKPVCGSPRTFAACRALLRLPAPRHPPCALHTFGPFRAPRPVCLRISEMLSFCAMRLSGCPRSVALASPGGRTLRVVREVCLLKNGLVCLISLERR